MYALAIQILLYVGEICTLRKNYKSAWHQSR